MKNQEKSDNILTCTAGFEYKLHKKPYWEAPKGGTVTKYVYTTDSKGWGRTKVISKKEFLDESNGYVKVKWYKKMHTPTHDLNKYE